MHFDSFGIEYIPQEELNKINDKSITHNIIKIQDDDCIMCKFYFLFHKIYHTNLISQMTIKRMIR